MRFLKRLRLHGSSMKLPETTQKRHARLGPQRLHQFQTFTEPRNERFGINTERGEHPRASTVAKPISSRPRLSWSKVAMLLASWSGLWSELTNAMHPIRIRSVHAAA